MSSGLLYLAIVGVWALVLVPMWLHGNEAGERSRARLLARRGGPTGEPRHSPPPPDGGVPGEAHGQPAEHAHATRLESGSDVTAAPGSGPGTYDAGTDPRRVSPPPAADRPAARPAAVPAAVDRLPGGPRRARVIARRRRRLFGISLLFLTAVVLAVSHLAPSWVIAPPTVLLAAYLAVLRAAGQIDAERRQSLAARSSAAPPRAEPFFGASSPAGAEVIPLAPEPWRTDEPYDQYTDAGLRAVGD